MQLNAAPSRPGRFAGQLAVHELRRSGHRCPADRSQVDWIPGGHPGEAVGPRDTKAFRDDGLHVLSSMPSRRWPSSPCSSPLIREAIARCPNRAIKKSRPARGRRLSSRTHRGSPADAPMKSPGRRLVPARPLLYFLPPTLRPRICRAEQGAGDPDTPRDTAYEDAKKPTIPRTAR